MSLHGCGTLRIAEYPVAGMSLAPRAMSSRPVCQDLFDRRMKLQKPAIGSPGQ